MQNEFYPKFHNDIAAPVVRIGNREFKCIGATPPHDHPHIYLDMGDADGIICPYCATRFCFDPGLGDGEADPPECAYPDTTPNAATSNNEGLL